MIKNTNDGSAVWYSCPDCGKLLTITGFCPEHKKLGKMYTAKDWLSKRSTLEP